MHIFLPAVVGIQEEKKIAGVHGLPEKNKYVGCDPSRFE
jgi:ArsR family transcriptional regulator